MGQFGSGEWFFEQVYTAFDDAVVADDTFGIAGDINDAHILMEDGDFFVQLPAVQAGQGFTGVKGFAGVRSQIAYKQ